MPRPSKVKIGPYRYKILWCKGKMGDLAKHDLYNCTITVREDLHIDQVRVSLIHEILHAIVGVTMDRQNEENGMDEEKFIQKFAPTLYGTLRDNPEVRHFLFDGE